MADKHTKVETQLLNITSTLLKDLKQERALRALSLDADLEQELGIGSLEKAELFRRIEEVFDIQLAEALLTDGENLRDLIAAITLANPYIQPEPNEQYPELPSTQIDTSKAITLVEVLSLYAKHEPDRPHIYLQNEHGHEKVIDYGSLYEAASAVAKGLANLGLKPKQTVAIMLPSSEEFFYAFFGVLIAGGIPVPIYPPFRANRLEEYMRREASILNNAHTKILITFEQVEKLSHLLKSFVPDLTHITMLPTLLKFQHQKKLNIKLYGEDPALIQYTSGSTGDPKGVLLSHFNLLENIRALGDALEVKPTDVIVSWLPLYHDMGLIGAWLGALYFGVPATIMSPLTFLTHPEKWLWAIHYHRATLAVAPNFAYELCLCKIPDKKLEGLDLSSLRMSMNGAETIYPNTLRNFYKRFKKYGLRRSTQCPAYGLAENSVGLAISDIHSEPQIDIIDREIFDTERRAEPITDPKRPTHEFVNCGYVLPRHEVRVVDDDGMQLPDRAEGHLQFRGPSMMLGYFEHPEATNAITHEGWYDTGDYAYIADNGIYITGREKDVIIKAGRNLYPQEIEEIVGDINNVRKGCVVALGVRNAKRGTEKFIIIAETHATDKNTHHRIQADIVEQIATNMGLPPDEAIIVPPGTILKTSSGKLQRSATKKAYLEGELVKKPLPAKLQIVRIIAKGLCNKLKQSTSIILRAIYTAYVAMIAILLLLPPYPLVRFAPQKIARGFVKAACRLFLLLVGCPVRVNNKNNLQRARSKNNSVLYVANHTSYTDSIVLIATMSTNVLFVGKKELESLPIAGGYFKACGYLSVDRMDFTASMQDIEKIKTAMGAGNDIMIFPEGTFAYAIGVRPFKLGAYNLSIQKNAPLCTIGLKGTRRFLRAETSLFTPSKITINYGSIHVPTSNDFQEAIRLRDATREEICDLCDELPINLVRAGPDEII